MSEMIEHIKKSTIEAEDIEVYSMWTPQFNEWLTVNVPPGDREDAEDVLRENGYEIGSYERLRGNVEEIIDGEASHFVRIEAILSE